MDPIKKKRKLEKDHENDLRKFMRAAGWHTEKTHGSLFMEGWPDLYCIHKQHGSRWVEMKRPGDGELEASQKKKFQLWLDHGMGVWILTKVEDYPRLFDKPNWHWWLDPVLRKML